MEDILENNEQKPQNNFLDFGEEDIPNEGRNDQKKKISYDIMNELKPKEEPVNPSPENYPSISKKVPENTFDEGLLPPVTQTQELPQRITSKEIIDVQTNYDANMEGFMNTNGAEISRILKNPNDVSQNMTNLDILGMPSEKNEGDILDRVSPEQSGQVLQNEKSEPEGRQQKESQAKEEDFGLAAEPDQKKEDPPVEDKTDPENDNPILEAFEEPGPPKKDEGGFDDIFDNPEFNNLSAEPQKPLPEKKEKEKPEKPPKAETPVKNEDPPMENKKFEEDSIDDNYYSPDYYQDTGGYEDEGESNYYQPNYYGGGSDYEDEDKDYETYKRDETVKEGEKSEVKKQNEAVDFL